MSFQPRAQRPGLHAGACYFKWREGRERHEAKDVMTGQEVLLVSGGLPKTGKNATQYPKEHRTDAQQ